MNPKLQTPNQENRKPSAGPSMAVQHLKHGVKKVMGNQDARQCRDHKRYRETPSLRHDMEKQFDQKCCRRQLFLALISWRGLLDSTINSYGSIVFQTLPCPEPFAKQLSPLIYTSGARRREEVLG